MLRPPTRALPSVIVGTEKVLREADGPVERGSKSSIRVERCSPLGAPRKPVWCASEEPEEHKRHTFIPMPRAMKIPAAKEAVDKEW